MDITSIDSFVRRAENWLSDKSERPVDEIDQPISAGGPSSEAFTRVAPVPRCAFGRPVRPAYQIIDPSPEVLQLQQRADQLQLELERTNKVLRLQQRVDQVQLELERTKKLANQLQLELERTKKDLSTTKQELESNSVFGGKADIVSKTDIMTIEPTSSALVPAAPVATEPRSQNGRTPRAEITNASPEVVQLQQHLHQLKLELERTEKELSLTKQELESNRVFGNKSDVVSETDIITKVNALNDCIYCLASAIGDGHLDNVFKCSENQPSNNTKSFFGESLCNFVVDAKANSTHPRILVSLQACMNHFCVLVLSSEFDSIVNPEKTQMLQQISDAIKASQPKAVSARWRALVYSDNEASRILKQDQQSLFSLLIRRLSRLHGFPEKQLQSMFEEDFSELVNKMLDLRKMMYGDYVSGDIKVFAPSPGSEFDPEKMQVDDPRGKSQKLMAGPIMCTTTIGIARTLYVQRRQGDRWVDEEEYNVLCRANVVVSFDD